MQKKKIQINFKNRRFLTFPQYFHLYLLATIPLSYDISQYAILNQTYSFHGKLKKKIQPKSMDL